LRHRAAGRDRKENRKDAPMQHDQGLKAKRKIMRSRMDIIRGSACHRAQKGSPRTSIGDGATTDE
jgi:hypothetical protein